MKQSGYREDIRLVLFDKLYVVWYNCMDGRRCSRIAHNIEKIKMRRIPSMQKRLVTLLLLVSMLAATAEKLRTVAGDRKSNKLYL